MTRQTIIAGIVRTTAGPVQGSLEDGLLVFKGIPYAAPPVGDLRWKPAVPHPGWTGVFAAESFGASAPQPFDPTGSYDRVLGNHGTPPFDEDCLTLNVWTPATDSERRPVLVWIHGGGFVSGSGSLPVYHGDTFARNGDTVVVSINYRIGVFGFFLAESGDNGNLWLSDQSTALKWVHENIALFGGDPDNITVAGESGGAFSAATLAIQADTSPLIKRVILQSPPLGLKLDSIDDARRGTAQLFKAAGLDDDDVSSLRNMPWESVLGLSFQRFEMATRFGHWTTPFLPIIDGVSLLEHPLDTLINGGASDIDVLIGWNVDEASFSFALNPELQDVSKERVEERLAERFDATLLPTAYEAYAGEERIAKNPLGVLVDVISDELFRQPALELADARAASNPAWSYQFSFKSPAHGGRLGATHCLELPFTFNNLASWQHAPFVEGIDVDEFNALSGAMHAAWISFIRTGNPNGAGESGSSGTELPVWQPHGEDRTSQVYGTQIESVRDPLSLWRQLHATAGRKMRHR